MYKISNAQLIKIDLSNTESMILYNQDNGQVKQQPCKLELDI